MQNTVAVGAHFSVSYLPVGCHDFLCNRFFGLLEFRAER
jgi:hypothetical protein